MYKIIERKAGDFIDLENYSKLMTEINPEEEKETYFEIVKKFYLLLIGRIPSNEDECVEIINTYATEIAAIKEDYEFIYNPPQLPSTIEQQLTTIGDEYRKEFAETYGGYVELIYLLTGGDWLRRKEVTHEMTTQEFLFYGNYLLHKKYVENIK
jgi:hypothetical protein